VFHQKADDAAKADVCGLVIVRREYPCPPGFARANWGGLADAEIMRESGRKDNATRDLSG